MRVKCRCIVLKRVWRIRVYPEDHKRVRGLKLGDLNTKKYAKRLYLAGAV